MIRDQPTQENDFYTSEFNKLLLITSQAKNLMLDDNNFSLFDLKPKDKEKILIEIQPILNALK